MCKSHIFIDLHTMSCGEAASTTICCGVRLTTFRVGFTFGHRFTIEEQVRRGNESFEVSAAAFHSVSGAVRISAGS